MQIRHEIEIERQPEDVFDFLIDTATFRVVDPALVSYTPPGVMRLGLTGTFVHRRSGMIARSTWSVEELERPWRLRVAVRGTGYAMEEEANLAATNVGTRVTFVDSVRPTSTLGRLMVALAAGIMRRDLKERAARLGSALEGRDNNG